MTDEDRLDARLSALLGAPDPVPDPDFVARMARIVAAEQKLAAARARLWRRFTLEVLASAAVVAAFYLLWRLTPAGLDLRGMAIGPAMAAILILFLWFGVELRPFAAER
jgi:hypothetical protein